MGYTTLSVSWALPPSATRPLPPFPLSPFAIPLSSTSPSPVAATELPAPATGALLAACVPSVKGASDHLEGRSLPEGCQPN